MRLAARSEREPQAAFPGARVEARVEARFQVRLAVRQVVRQVAAVQPLGRRTPAVHLARRPMAHPAWRPAGHQSPVTDSAAAACVRGSDQPAR